MTFYLRKEWIDQIDGIDRVQICYAVTPLDQIPDWDHGAEWRELIPETSQRRKRRAKVIKLPRSLEGSENYLLHYFFLVQKQDGGEQATQTFLEEIVSDDHFNYYDYWGRYTNICVYWSIDGWGAPNYSTMFVDGIRLDHHLSSLHYYGRSHDGVYIYERFNHLQSLALPHIYRGRVHGPKGARINFCYHIIREGSPEGDDYAFWDNNEGLNYWKELR